MKRVIPLLSLLAITATSGCAGNGDLIRTSSISTRSDVFQELKDGGLIPAGFADLRITSSLKTHKPGIYSSTDVHGTPEYRLLINIDGQAVQVQGNLYAENIEPRGLRDPEAGEGIRYRFSKNLRLKAGTHKIVVAIPEDGIAVEREITLPEGNNNLVLEPLYGADMGKQRPGFYGVTSFTEGIKSFGVVLNGKSI